jgi:hypothetical protein
MFRHKEDIGTFKDVTPVFLLTLRGQSYSITQTVVESWEFEHEDDLESKLSQPW